MNYEGMKIASENWDDMLLNIPKLRNVCGKLLVALTEVRGSMLLKCSWAPNVKCSSIDGLKWAKVKSKLYGFNEYGIFDLLCLS